MTVETPEGGVVTRTMEVAEGKDRIDVEVPEGEVTGHVRDAGRRGVPEGVTLWLRAIDPGGDRGMDRDFVTNTERDGTYAFRSLTPGRYD